jgi:hypothetical protein
VIEVMAASAVVVDDEARNGKRKHLLVDAPATGKVDTRVNATRMKKTLNQQDFMVNNSALPYVRAVDNGSMMRRRVMMRRDARVMRLHAELDAMAEAGLLLYILAEPCDEQY